MTMRIVMVTPHLPPHQAANALLPHLLGQALRAARHEVRFVTLGHDDQRPDVAYIRRRAHGLRATRVPQLIEALETLWRATPLVKWADVVHVHSNTWMNQVAAEITAFHRRPYVLTHYGTEIWHHDGRDPAFRRLNRRAAHVTYYSQALMAKGQELDVPCAAASVIYPPVSDAFRPLSSEARARVRSRYVSEGQRLLLNVKRLHPLADQMTLLEAFARVRAERPEARLLIAGTGEMEGPLKIRAASLGLDSTVQFLGLVPNEEVALLQGAADLFVLSSALEATPTVALEALASGVGEAPIPRAIGPLGDIRRPPPDAPARPRSIRPRRTRRRTRRRRVGRGPHRGGWPTVAGRSARRGRTGPGRRSSPSARSCSSRGPG